MEEQKQPPKEPGMALEKVPPKDLKAWINSDQFKAALRESLPSHMTPDRYARICLTAMMRTPKLAQCTQVSLFKAMLDCSSLGLEPDGRRAHLIPYDVKEKGTWKVIRTEAQLIIDYKGIVELAKRSGEVASIRAELVCEKDEFSWENGIVTHRIDWRAADRGKVQCVYSHVRNKNGIDEYEVMTLKEIDAIRARSKAKDSGPWVTDYNEMAKKTVIRRHSKKLTLSPEFADALEKDADRLDTDGDTSGFTLDDIMPKAQSEVDAAQVEVQVVDAEIVPEGTKQTAEATPPAPPPQKVDPEAVVSADSLGKVLKVFQETKLDKAKLDTYLANVIGVKSIDKLKEKDVERVCAWLRNASNSTK